MTHRITAQAVALLAASTATGQTSDMPTVSYAELGKLVREQKGKVVVVYFWEFG
jgi:hypothetical protein